MRLKKISILILNIIFVVLWVCIQSCSLIFLTVAQKNKADEACTKIEASFRDLFWKIESANMLMRPYEFLNSLAYKSTEEMEELGFLDVIDGKLTMEKMNIIIGSPCVCALYFEKSGYVLTASGLVRLSEYANRFATIEGTPTAVEDAVSAMPDFDILTSVQYIGDNNNYARSSVFIRKNNYYNNISFITIISEEYFDDMLASTFLENGGSIGIVYKGDLLYGKAVGVRHSLSYFHIDVYAQKRFDFELGNAYVCPSQIYALCEKIRQVFEERGTDNDLRFPEYRDLSIFEILANIINYIDGYTFEEEQGNSVNLVKFEALKKFINDNLTNADLSLKYLSAKFHYSVSYISKLFSENDLGGYQKYVVAQRIELAKQLLKSGMTVEKISQSCGFRNIKTFRSAFKEYTGITPKEYREEYRSNIGEDIE